MRRIGPAVTILAVVAAVFVSGSCAPFDVPIPEGFAEVRSRGAYSAVSPEGMLLRVRTVKNEPRQDIDFWSEAVKAQLSREGYADLGREERFSVAGRGRVADGYLVEWGVPYRRQDYIYMTAIIPVRRSIIVIEAAGEYSLYERYRAAMLESIKAMSIR